MQLNHQEKHTFTHRRSKQLLAASKLLNNEEDYKRLKKLEHTYGKYCFVPLDLPKVNISEEFFEWFFEEAKPAIKLKPDIATPAYNKSRFVSIDVPRDTRKPAPLDEDQIWSTNFCEHFDGMWPDLYTQLRDLLPFNEMSFKMWSSTGDIIPHRDQTLFIDLPLDFRLLVDTNPVNNLFITEVLPDHQLSQAIQTIGVPTDFDTNFFAWNNLRCQHYSKFDRNHRKIIFIFECGAHINWQKYESLLERSVSKYQNHCMVSTNKITDFIFL